jgi:hypothetical protein
MIKIEVTGNSIPEVADKMLAISTSLLATENQRIYNKAAREEARFTEVELAEINKTIEALVPKSAPATSELSFETDVTPVVLAVVQTKGKPVVEEILSQFGVARASQLDPARWPELVAALQDKL